MPTTLVASTGGSTADEKLPTTTPTSTEVDFDGPDDPENPMNWGSGRKNVTVVIVTLMTLLSPIGSTINSSSTLEILHHFNSTNTTLGSFVTTVFLLGYVFGPMLIAPLSELYGRALLYKSCMLLFIVFNIACAVANSLGSLIAFRFLAGIAGSCPITLGTGTIADIIPREKRAAAMGAYMLGAVFGPTLGPIAGGFLAPAAGWRWTFWLVAIAAGVVTLLALFFVRESYAYVLLERKAAKLRQQTGNAKMQSVMSTGKTARDHFVFSIMRPLKMLLSPIIFSLSLYAAIVYSYLYLCFTTFEIVFAEYGFNSGEAGLATLGIGIGSIIAIIACGATAEKVSEHLTAKYGGEPLPEYRLPAMVVGGFCTPVGLFWYGWSAEAGTHWIVPVLGTSFIGMGLVLTYMASSMYLVDAYTVHAASVTAATTIVRCILGALLPLAGPSMYSALGLGWGNSLLGFIALAFIPLPFVFYVYGQRIRQYKGFNVQF